MKQRWRRRLRVPTRRRAAAAAGAEAAAAAEEEEGSLRLRQRQVASPCRPPTTHTAASRWPPCRTCCLGCIWAGVRGPMRRDAQASPPCTVIPCSVVSGLMDAHSGHACRV